MILAEQEKQAFIKQLQEHWQANRTTETVGNLFARVEMTLPEMDILNWLRKQDAAVKTYWSGRENDFAMAGIGAADIVSGRETDYPRLFAGLQSTLTASHPHIRYYGGLQFHPNSLPDVVWKKFQRYCFLIPRFELFKASGRTVFAINYQCPHGREADDRLIDIVYEFKQLDFSDIILNEKLPRYVKLTQTPNKKRWIRSVSTALQHIDEGTLQKIVLAGQSILKFEEGLDPAHLLQKLALHNPASFHFCLQLFPNMAFLGATPERLYRRDGRTLFSEAVAGTRPRSSDPVTDAQLGDALLSSDKDLREHRWVSDMIRSSLAPLCEMVQTESSEQLLQLQYMQHLQTLFKGRLRELVGDGDIIARLHPTPAVGGFPGPESLALIAELEPFARGWYAGPVGWIGQDAAEFAVAIRSGLIAGKSLSLFAGSGIVRGSDPQKEWEENETKLLNFTRLFQ
ncbi:MAG TPA: isochorismate synthase [bacterium]|nr:isochorismate synthase [bacterium]HPN44954.1 isochorismate synthase [bacterium]